METIKKTWNNFRDTLGVFKIASTYMLSNIIKYPEAERYRINSDTYVRLVSNPENAIGNIFIIQGGLKHTDTNSYYIKTSLMFMSRNVRVFLFEKHTPVANLEISHDIAKCVDYVKEHFDGPICLIGYSMGGILLWNYLGLGYDQADLYVPLCCPLDMYNFYETIDNNAVFRYIKRTGYKHFDVISDEQLLEKSGTTYEKHKQCMDNFIPQLNRHRKKWFHKTIYVVSSDDPITKNFEEERKMLKRRPLTYVVQNGWHCCLDSILLGNIITCNYLKERSIGNNPKIEDIKYF